MTDHDLFFAARYPCADTARRVVADMDATLGDAATGHVDAGDAVTDRARERVESALTAGHTGSQAGDSHTELLSYPVARAIASLADDGRVATVYADAEAATIRERVDTALDTDAVPVDRFLAEFGLVGDADADAVRAAGDGFEVALERYLEAAAATDDDAWRLPERAVHEGWVPVEEHEVAALVERAAAQRVRDGLPVPVPVDAQDALEADVDAVERIVRAADVPTDVGTGPVAPASFPPCIRALLRSVRADGIGALGDRSRFVLVSFLATVGVDDAEAAALFGDAGEDGAQLALADQLDRLRDGDAVAYPTPSCVGLDATGDCTAPDGRCETVESPTAYYAAAVSDRGAGDAGAALDGGETA